MKPCDYCDEPGGLKTYENQVLMPINGKVECIDHCIHKIVAALNAGGVETVACCCGHGKVKGNIVLSDGRVLIILPKHQRTLIHGAKRLALRHMTLTRVTVYRAVFAAVRSTINQFCLSHCLVA